MQETLFNTVHLCSPGGMSHLRSQLTGKQKRERGREAEQQALSRARARLGNAGQGKTGQSRASARQGRARQGNFGTKEALPKHVHTVSTLTRPLSAWTKALRSFFTQFQPPDDKSPRTHRVPNVVNLQRVLTVFL